MAVEQQERPVDAVPNAVQEEAHASLQRKIEEWGEGRGKGGGGRGVGRGRGRRS